MRLTHDARQGARGVTLIELVIGLAISSVILAGIYQTFHTQERSYRQQNELASLQNNLRAAEYLLVPELRGAGYDPLFTRRFGFVTQFPAPYDSFSIDYTKQTDRVAFTVDDKEDGVPDNLNNGVLDATIAELIAYRFNAVQRVLERFDVHDPAFPRGTWKGVMDRVEAVNFVYYDSAGVRTTDPAEFRYVEVSVVVRSDAQELGYTKTQTYTNKLGENICPSCTKDHHRRRMWNTIVQVRNPQFRNPLGFESL